MNNEAKTQVIEVEMDSSVNVLPFKPNAWIQS